MKRGGGFLKVGNRVVTKQGRHPVLEVVPQENPSFLRGGGGPTSSRPRTGRKTIYRYHDQQQP
jgi:hypothetical protein